MDRIEFVYSETYEKFINELNIGNVTSSSIVFINDVRQIWARGTFYGTKLTASEVEDIVISSPSIEQFITQLISKSTNGVVLDNAGEGLKFLSDDGTYREIDNKVMKLSTSNQLSFYCIEPVTVTVGGEATLYPANSYVTVFPNDAEFSITTTSNNSILNLTSWPGALSEFYPWLEGVQLFSNILFDMNDLAMYEKWNQGHQGQYHVQFAQYVNCIFWSDNAYVSAVDERTNYTLYYSSQLPLCYSTIPENTFKSFYCAYGVTSDPNWSNQAYKDSFAAATWATQVFSYYGLKSIGMFDMDASYFNIVLPKDCRGLMFYAPNIQNAGVFDAANTTNFGAKSGSWRDAFAYCYSLETLYIKNLKVNLNISWSPINQHSLDFILSNAANTSKITIYLSPFTYNSLTDSNIALAAEKNVTLSVITTNTTEDKRVSCITLTGDGTKFLSNDGTYKSIKMSEIENDANYVTSDEVDSKISAIVGAAPDGMNTLELLANKVSELSSHISFIEI